MKLLQAIAAALIALLAAVAYNSTSAGPRPDYVINDVAYRGEFKQYANDIQVQQLRRKLLNEVAVDREYAKNGDMVALDIEMLGHDAPAWTGAMCDNIGLSAFAMSARLRHICNK